MEKELRPELQNIVDKLVGVRTKTEGSSSPELDRIREIRASSRPTDGGMFGDIKNTVSDIGASVSKRMDTTQDIFNATASGEQGLLRSAGQLFGQGAGLASDVVGSTIMGTVKQLTPDAIQKPIGEAVKGAVGAVVETEPVQKLVNWYSNLDEAKKRDLDAVLGTVSLATDVIGGAVAKKPVQQAVTKGIDVASDVTKKGVQVTKDMVGKVVDPTDIMQRVARINPTQQTKFKTMAGESVGEYLTNRKIFGSADEVLTKVADKFQQSKKMADDSLATLKGTYKPTPIKTVIDDLLKKEVSISSKGALSKDLKTVMGWRNKFQKDGLTMSEINEVKRMYERNVKMDFLRQNLPEGVKRANTLDDAIRNWQVKKAEELGLANLPEINKETQLAKMLADALGKKLAGSEANNAVSLTDWIMLSGGDATAIAGYIGKKALSSGKLQGKVAEFVSKNRPTKTVTPKVTKPKPSLEDFMKK